MSEPVPFLRTEFRESQGQLSPDGRWIAYTSDESGQIEIYVRPFPTGSGKWRISTNGGIAPRWRRDGKELFYVEISFPRSKLVAVPTPGRGTVFEPGSPQLLFEYRGIPNIPESNLFPYSPSANGQRFLLATVASDTEATLNVITNWEKAVASVAKEAREDP